MLKKIPLLAILTLQPIISSEQTITTTSSHHESATQELLDVIQYKILPSVEYIQLLINKGANIHAFNYYGLSILYLAAHSNHFNVTQLLLQHGAHPNSFDIESLDLEDDIQKDLTDITNLLIEYGAESNSDNIACCYIKTQLQTTPCTINTLKPPLKLSIIKTLIAHKQVTILQKCLPIAQCTEQEIFAYYKHCIDCMHVCTPATADMVALYLPPLTTGKTASILKSIVAHKIGCGGLFLLKFCRFAPLLKSAKLTDIRFTF